MINLLKVHGSENTFFLLDQNQLSRPLTEDELIQTAVKITDGSAGILGGADGLLVVDDGVHQNTLGRMRVINSDGSIASMCGNGLRTVSRYLCEKYEKDEFLVETAEADLQVGRAPALGNGVATYHVEISPVRFETSALPMNAAGRSELIHSNVADLNETIKFSAIAVPNPHLIAIEEPHQILNKTKLGELGQRFNEKNPWFPDGVNVSFGRVIGQNQIFVETYERGVGFTNACGTGMAATSVIWTLLNDGKTGVNTVNNVYNPGGMVQTRVRQDDGEYKIDLIGNATFTHQIQINEEQLRKNHFEKAKIVETGEEESYQEFVKALPSYSF